MQSSVSPPDDNIQTRNLMSLGHVTGVSDNTHTVEVVGYRSGVEFSKVPVMGMGFWLPQIGDTVVFSFIGEDNENPIILGRILETDHGLHSNIKDAINIHRIMKNESGDITGEIDVHSDSNGNLSITLAGLKGNIDIITKGNEGNINLYGQGEINIGVGSNATLQCGGDLAVESMGKVTVDCDGNATLISRGDAKILTEGDTEISTKGKTIISSEDDTEISTEGKTVITAEGEVQVDGDKVLLGKNMSKHPANNYPVCLFTGAAHIAPENSPQDHIVEI